MTLIEAIPNVSEGRRATVLDRLTSAVETVAGVTLLDLSSDPSHNRSVLTMVGPAEPLLDALIRLYEVVVPLVDLRSHEGVHPRMGAVDVVPFVPLRDASMDDCVTLANRLGQAVGERLEIPVYLYGHAANRPQHRRLEDIRRGQFESLAEKMRDPTWRPDYGPPRPHPTAGASAIGAREPLIAFNINLATDDIDAARQIARTIRERDGGLACVKAIGVRLQHRGLVQVSINLTDFRTTSLPQVFEAVAQNAARRGIEIADTELVGLVPLDAMATAAAHALRLNGFTGNQVLEARLAPASRPQPPGPAAER